MKKNILTVLILSAAAVLILAGCAQNSGTGITQRTVTIKGTAGNAAGSKAVTYGIDSVSSVKVNNTDITDRLVPVGSVKAGQNNVTFQAQVEVPAKVSFSAAAKPGYVFDEWEVIEPEEKADRKLAKKVDKWLDYGNRENSETLENIPAEYLPYIMAEYDNGFHIALGSTASAEHDGTKDRPYTVDEFKAIKYEEEELTLVVSGKNDAEFAALMAHIETLNKLEELKLKADQASLAVLPALTLEEISLSGFTFTEPVTIDNATAEYSFDGCTFEKTLAITKADEVEIENSTCADIIVTAVKELEIEDSAAGKIDLKVMTEGEVELENVTAAEIIRPDSSNVEITIE